MNNKRWRFLHELTVCMYENMKYDCWNDNVYSQFGQKNLKLVKKITCVQNNAVKSKKNIHSQRKVMSFEKFLING